MADPLAIHAAIVGTVCLGWQIWREMQRRRTDLRVEFEHAAKLPRVLVARISDPGPRPYPIGYELSVRLASGPLIESKVDHLLEHPLEDIATHNRTARP